MDMVYTSVYTEAKMALEVSSPAMDLIGIISIHYMAQSHTPFSDTISWLLGWASFVCFATCMYDHYVNVWLPGAWKSEALGPEGLELGMALSNPVDGCRGLNSPWSTISSLNQALGFSFFLNCEFHFMRLKFDLWKDYHLSSRARLEHLQENA